MSKSSTRSSHASKTIPQRASYQKYIRTTESQPTVDDNIPFDTTHKRGSGTKETSSRRKRPIPFGTQLVNYLNKNKIGWIVGLFILFLAYFYVDARIEIAVLHANLANQKEQIENISIAVENNHRDQMNNLTNINSMIKGIDLENNNQNILINELLIRIKNLEEKITKNQP